jgi:multidrug efflux pump subunit AcrA (membrane-fusion protein)
VVRAVGKEALPRQNLQGSARQVRVRCQPVNPAFPIPPGTEVDIDGDVPLAADAVLVPTNAVVRDGPHDYVWAADGSRVHRREVEIGPNNFDLIQVHSGLAAGETVVTEGKQGLAEGDRARATRLERGAGGQQGGP